MTKLIGNSTLAERERGLKFAENFASSAAVSENGGTETNSPVTPFLFAGNGTDETYINYVYESEPRQATTELTVMAWVYPTVAPDGTGRTVINDYAYSAVPADERGWAFGDIYGSEDHFGLWVYNSTESQQQAFLVGFFASYLNQWTHVAATFSGGNYIRLYVNGILVDEETTSMPTYIDYYPGNNLRIGQRSDGVHGKWAGNIKDVKVFYTALEVEEIEQYATNTMYSYRNEAIAEWPMTYAQHDPDNSQTLDIIGTNHLELQGATSKNRTTRGYRIDTAAGDFLRNLSTNITVTGKDWTIMSWFKHEPSVAFNWNAIFQIQDDDGTLLARMDTTGSYASKLRARLDTSALANQTCADIGELGSDWVLATLTFDNATNTATLYFNDAKESSSVVVVGTLAGTNINVIGGGGQFDGTLAYMKLWYQKLSPIQIADQYYTLIKGVINRK